MTATEKARRSDALYYDDYVMHRRNLCDMVAEREDRIEELEAENAKLRERVAKLEELLPENGRWFRAETVEAYVDEIAKLRELVKDSVSLLDETCDAYYESDYHAIVDRARELGVEVGE